MEVAREKWLDKHHQEERLYLGFKDLDYALGGLMAGDLIVIGGRPSMGKTQFMSQLALQVKQFFFGIFL